MRVGSRSASAIQFFVYETPKVLILLFVVVFAVGIVRTFFTPERTRRALAGKRETAGNALAAPMVNEVALALLFGLFGWHVAALYLGTGLVIAISAGWTLGRLRLERWIEPWVLTAVPGAAATGGKSAAAWSERVRLGRAAVQEIVGRVWPFVLAGIAAGAAIHGYVPENFMASLMGKAAWWSVPLAVLIGVPMYSNAVAIIPVVEALLAKGAALGTVLAFMMSVIALSLPEMIILRKVLKPPLIFAFAAVVALGILLVGYLFNAVL